MQIVRWGNGLAVRLPAAMVDALQLKEGDEVEVQIAGKRESGVPREDLLRQLRVFRGRLPADFRFDRDEASGR